MKSYYQNCTGQIVIIVALTLVVLVGMVGLAIDSGLAYGVKAKLSSAVDAAAIAGGRALTVGANDAERVASAQSSAQKFFYGNFPSNYFGANPTSLNAVAVHDAQGFWRISVSAAAAMPTTFMRVLGQNGVTVAAQGEAIRRDLDMILVLDNSGSLGSAFPSVKTSAKSFIDKFIESSDRVGLVSFASGAELDVAVNKTATRGFNKTAVKNAIDAMDMGGVTAAAEGMRRALNEINAIPPLYRSSLRVIVFFSDGAPNTVPATFTRTSGNPRTVTGDLFSEVSSGGTPNTVYRYDRIDSELGSYSNMATLPNNSGATLAITGIGSIPLASDNNLRTFTNFPSNTRCNVNKAARNMVENVANTARSWREGGYDQPVAIYSLGLGQRLNQLEINFCGYSTPPSLPAGACPTPTQCPECGCNIMKRLANTADAAPHHDAPQPTGGYCYADISANPNALDSCFSAIASAILRLSM